MIVKRFLLLTCLGFTIALYGIGQDLSAPEFQQLLSRLRQNTRDSAGVNVMLRLAKYYITKPGETKKDLDSAFLLVRRAELLSKKLSYQEGLIQVNILQAAATRESGEPSKAKPFAEKAVELSHQAKQYGLLGHSYMELANYYSPWGDSTEFLKNQELYQQAYTSFKQAGDVENQAFCLKYLADLESNMNDDPTQALTYLHQALALYKSIGYKQLQGVYDLFGFIYANNNDYTSAVKYGLLAVQTADQVGDSSVQLSTIYNRIGRSYYLLKDFQSAKTHFLKALQIAEREKSKDYIYDIAPNAVNALMRLNELPAALHILNDLFVKKYPSNPGHYVTQETINSFYVFIYTKMKKLDKAREYYNKIINSDDAKFDHIGNYFDLHRLVPYLLETKQYTMAERCLKEYDKRATAAGSIHDLGYNHPLWFKLDSTRGNYLSAIAHYQKYKQFDDSIFNASKSKLMAITRVEYETARKDQDIKIKTQSIDLLTKTNEVQKTKLEKSTLLQNTTFAGIGVLLLVFGLLYNQYRIKKRNNQEISRKNLSLQRLVDEKELLLKEVHHRVKNNLHIVMSLLESQSAYLKNDALLAIQNSQNRVYAMSLIHQKLYQSRNVTNIDMGVYLPELVHHLRDSFDLHQGVHFQCNIERISLDISQAIPVGLIVNEAITNSIKYAFPPGRRGSIAIDMTRSPAEKIILSIEDDGIGLPQDFNYLHANSLGMKLMKGLSEDIQGEFFIEQVQGTRIVVVFEENILLRSNTIINKSGQEVYS